MTHIGRTPVVWIQQAHIERLAGKTEPTVIKFNRGVNVCWGLNGSGKTSFLKILHSALSDESSSLLHVPFSRAVVTFYSENRQELIQRELAMSVQTSKRLKRPGQKFSSARIDHLIDQGFDADDIQTLLRSQSDLIDSHDMASWKTQPQDATDMRFEHRYMPTSRIFPDDRRRRRIGPSNVERARPTDDASYDRMFANNIQEIWERYSTVELMKVREIQQRGLAAILNFIVNRPSRNTRFPTTTDIKADEAYRAVRDFFREQKIPISISPDAFKSTYEKDDVLAGVVAEVVDVEHKIRESQLPARKLEDLVSELFSGRKKLHLGSTVSVQVGKTEIPVEHLSSGEKQLLLILLESITGKSNCIIIDEPEVSMHVDWQRRLIGSMQTLNPNVQLILATHSPEVMVGLDEHEIFEL